MTTITRKKNTMQDVKSLTDQGPERVARRKETDQRFHALNSMATVENPTVKLPLFSETLFKARDFDPL